MTTTTKETERWALSNIEDALWKRVRIAWPDYSPSRTDLLCAPRADGWVLCPRSHAAAHLRCIVEITDAGTWSLRFLTETFQRVGRFFPGEDLVFAVGDLW